MMLANLGVKAGIHIKKSVRDIRSTKDFIVGRVVPLG